MVSQRRGATSLYHGFDPQGNVRLLTGSAGTAVDQYSYHAFGDGETVTGSDPNPFQYGGEVGYYQDGTDRLYVRARHYRSDLGAWLSADPVASEPRYQYVYNNPTGFIDPTGTATSVIGAGAAPALPGPGIVQSPSVPLPPPPLAPPVIGARFPDWGYNPGVTYGSSSPNLSGASLLAAPDTGLPPGHPLNLAYPGVRSPAGSWLDQFPTGSIKAPIPNLPAFGFPSPPPGSSLLGAAATTDCGHPDSCQGIVSSLMGGIAKWGNAPSAASLLAISQGEALGMEIRNRISGLISPQSFAGWNAALAQLSPNGLVPTPAAEILQWFDVLAEFNLGVVEGFFTEACETFNIGNLWAVLTDFGECLNQLLNDLRRGQTPQILLDAQKAGSTLAELGGKLWNDFWAGKLQLQQPKALDVGRVLGAILFHIALQVLLNAASRAIGAAAGAGVGGAAGAGVGAVPGAIAGSATAGAVGGGVAATLTAARLMLWAGRGVQGARAFSAAHQPGKPCLGPVVGALTLATAHAAGKAASRGVAAIEAQLAARAAAKQAGVAKKLVQPSLENMQLAQEGSSGSEGSRVFRVQGGTPPKASFERVTVDAEGRIIVEPEPGKPHQTKLYVSFDDLDRVRIFLREKRPGGRIVSFEVDPDFAAEVRANAVRQVQAKTFPDAPEISDPTRATSVQPPGEGQDIVSVFPGIAWHPSDLGAQLRHRVSSGSPRR